MMTLEQIILDTAEMVRPPERINVWEAAEKYRHLNNPGSYIGPYKTDMTPYMREPMEVLTSLDYTAMIFAGPARTGKTDLLLNYIAYTAKCDPADMMVVQMSQNVGRDWSIGDLRKMFRESPDLKDLVAPGRHNMNVHDIMFRSGMRLLVKWPSINELSGKTIPRLWLVDYDRMPMDVDKQGDPFSLAKKRAQTFRRFGMTVAEASPGKEVVEPKWMPQSPHEAPPTTGILSLYNDGDRRWRYWVCVKCKHAFAPDFSLFRWSDSKDKVDRAHSVTMPCPHCGFAYTHDGGPKSGPGKMTMEREFAFWMAEGQTFDPNTGEIVGDRRRTDIASFWLKGPSATFTNWAELVLKFLNAEEEFEKTGDETKLKATINVDQGLPYIPRSALSDREPGVYKERADGPPIGVVPLQVRYLTAAVDIQKSSFVCQVFGHDDLGDLWLVDRFVIRKSNRLDDDGERLWVKPGEYPEDWQILVSELIEKTYPIEGSKRLMRIKASICDSGGSEGVTANAYAFWRWLRDDHDGEHHRRFRLLKGASAMTAPRVQQSFPDADRKDRRAAARGEVPVLLINPNLLKDQLNNMLGRLEPGGGYIHFATGLPDEVFRELCVEIRDRKGAWTKKPGSRNEAWDLFVYTLALNMTQTCPGHKIDWSKPPAWAETHDKNELVVRPVDAKSTFRGSSKPAIDLSKLGRDLA